MTYYQAKEYHDRDLPRDGYLPVVVKGEIFKENEIKDYRIPMKWFRKISANVKDTYWFFGTRRVDEGFYKVLEEDLT